MNNLRDVTKCSGNFIRVCVIKFGVWKLKTTNSKGKRSPFNWFNGVDPQQVLANTAALTVHIVPCFLERFSKGVERIFSTHNVMRRFALCSPALFHLLFTLLDTILQMLRSLPCCFQSPSLCICCMLSYLSSLLGSINSIHSIQRSLILVQELVDLGFESFPGDQCVLNTNIKSGQPHQCVIGGSGKYPV